MVEIRRLLAAWAVPGENLGMGLAPAFMQVATQFLGQPVIVAGKFLFAGNAFSQRPRFWFLGHGQPYHESPVILHGGTRTPGPSIPAKAAGATLASDRTLWQGSPALTTAAVAQG